MTSNSTKNNNASKRRRRGKNIYAALVLIMCMSAAAFMGYLAYQELTEREEGDGYYESLAGQLSARQEPGGEAATEETALPEETKGPEAGATEEPVPEMTPPPAEEETGSRIDFEALRETCPDAVGWITMENSPIDYPVVQGEDNDYYLTHLPNGKKNEAGSIMMDAACSGEFLSEITILHGHNMRSGAMFGSLDLYSNEGYFEEHSTLELCTPEGDFEVQLYAGWIVDKDTFTYPTGFLEDEEFEEFLHTAKLNSHFESDVVIERGDRMLMLSTCAYVFEDARFVLLGKIVEEE